MERKPVRKTLAGRVRKGLAGPVLALILTLGLAAGLRAQAKAGDVSIGTRYIFTSDHLKGEIPVRVHLPATLPAGAPPPPTLYVLEIADDFTYAAATADFLARCGRIPGLIVVAVDVDKLSGLPQGMIDFLDKELIPFVERTAGAGPRRILFGHSGRSFAALFILLNRPELFEGYICASLGLTWPLEKGRMDFAAMAEDRWSQRPSLPKALVFSLGDEEKFTAGIERFTSVLKSKAPSDLRWTYLHLPGEDHDSTKLKTLYQGLEFIFAPARSR
ncbi:MAG TPA: alpha/beta hydrolase-fold protein [Acidobacteriota bacterium]|nr:alpha/beta hydrolase-fold protein [Acidobacteriota bacterium]